MALDSGKIGRHYVLHVVPATDGFCVVVRVDGRVAGRHCAATLDQAAAMAAESVADGALELVASAMSESPADASRYRDEPAAAGVAVRRRARRKARFSSSSYASGAPRERGRHPGRRKRGLT